MARLERGPGDVRPSMPLAVLRSYGSARRRTPHRRAVPGPDPDGRIDPSGLVKGWAVDRVGALLSGAGLRHWCVNAAGDVLVHGQARPGEGWTIGIVDPRRRERLVDTLTLTVGAVATSGSAERGDHIWGPPTEEDGRRGDEVLSVSVTARDIVERRRPGHGRVRPRAARGGWLGGFPGVEGLVVLADGTVEPTSGWPGSAGPALDEGGR